MRKKAGIVLIITCISIFMFSGVRGQNNPYGKVEGDSLYSTGWSFGLNLGAYFANRYQANFYSGAPGNADSIGLVFGNKYYVDQIKAALNTDTLYDIQLPLKMHYQPAMMVGFHIKYNMTHNLGIFFQFNYQGLTAKDVCTMSLGPAGIRPGDSIIYCPIWGKEDRMNIDIGLSKDFPLEESIHVFAEAGMNINYVRVKENQVMIASTPYSLINIYGDQPYIPNTQLQTYTVHLGGWGMGGFLSAGFRFIFNNHISIDPGATFYWNQTKLTGYTAFKPNFDVFVRLSYQNLVTKEKFRR